MSRAMNARIGLAWRVALGALALVALVFALNARSHAGAGVPNAPTNLQALVVHDALKISLMWQDNAGNEDQFILERSSTSSDGPWGVAALLPAGTTMYSDSGLSDGVTYWYRVAATNQSGTSAYSNVVSGTASALPHPPLGDADCNLSVNSVDAALVLQYDAGLVEMLACSEFADVNGSGDVNSLDAALILQFVAGLIHDFEPNATSGIRGLVTIGPMCPVMQKGVPCPDQPFSAKIVIEDGEGGVVTSVVSGDDGMFEVGLTPGDYLLVPQSPNQGGIPHASEMNVSVSQGAFTEVLIQYDSGIR